MKKVVAITGCTGMVGAELCHLFLRKNKTENEQFEIHGLKRRSSQFNTERIDDIFDQIKLHYGDLSDANAINNFVSEVQPDIFINCAAQSHVQISWAIPYETSLITGAAVVSCLEAVRKYAKNKNCCFIQMASSEMMGNKKDADGFQRITTPFHPLSTYASAKVFAFNSVQNYRESYGMNAKSIVAFNIENFSRGGNFVTKKISSYVGKLHAGIVKNKLRLGSKSSYRDWNFLNDTCEAIYLMAMTKNSPKDYVVASGDTHTVEEFCDKAFGLLGYNYKDHVEFDCPEYLRPNELTYLRGDATPIREELGWKPTCTFSELVKIMVDYDVKKAKEEKLLIDVRK